MPNDLELMPFQRQLEEYPPIKAMLLVVAKNPALLKGVGQPWRVYGQRHEGGKWAKKDFLRYKDAFKFLKPRLSTYRDISITSKRLSFAPPGRVVRIKRGGEPVMVKTANGFIQKTKIVAVSPPPGHLWCIYCRRFTVFTWFMTHHAFPRQYWSISDQSTRRCCVCGIREVIGAWRH